MPNHIQHTREGIVVSTTHWCGCPLEQYIICWQSEDGLVLESDPPRVFGTLEKADEWIAEQTHKPGFGYAVVKLS